MALLEIKDLSTSIFTESGEISAVRNVSFDLDAGQILGIVGESGSGKSMTAYSIMQILPRGAKIVGGSVKYKGNELIGAKKSVLERIRGNKISIIFQDPMTSLNPTLSIGRQITEVITLHTKRTKEEAKKHAAYMLRTVGIADAERRLKQYPFELSGGMRQRIMIAMALACEPDILIADEPTTALDVTIQAQILELMKDLGKRMNMAILMITHDLGAVAELCDKVIIMYAGGICESGTVDDIFYSPSHEYTKGLLRSVPTPDTISKRLIPIGGSPIDLYHLPLGCKFAPRCPMAMSICHTNEAPTARYPNDHLAYCWMNQKRKFYENKEIKKE